MIYFLVGYISFPKGGIGGAYYNKEEKSFWHSKSTQHILINNDGLRPLKVLRNKQAEADGETVTITVNKAVAFDVGALIP